MLKWLREGSVDYLAPQLYWPIDQAPQSFAVLLPWWYGQNPQRRHVWPGLNASGALPKKGAWREDEGAVWALHRGLEVLYREYQPT